MSSCKLYGDKIWNNNPAISEPSAFAPVVDENLEIIGTNGLVNHIHIMALTQDVLVTVTNGPAIVRSNDDLDQVELPALHLFAETDFTITFSLTDDLLFSGSHQELLITFSGGGNLVFMIAGGHTLTFGADGDREPAIFAVNMDQLVNSPDVRDVVFRRFPIGALPDLNDDATVLVNNGGRIVYVSTNPADSADTATIAFDASNVGRGRLILSITTEGGVLVSGRSIATLDDPIAPDVDFSLRAGGRAIFEAFNGQTDLGAYSGFAIVNNNKTLPVLYANPWCQLDVCPDGGCTADSFPGFILDQNGRITIADQTYIDYIVTATNQTPIPNIPLSILEDRTVNSVIKDRNPAALFVDGAQTATTHAQIVFEGNSAFYFRAGVDKDGGVSPTVFDPTVGDFVMSYTIDPLEQNRGLTAAGQILLDVEGTLDVIAADTDAGKAMNILSLHVTPTGGSVLIEESSTLFPRRTFARDELGRYLQYNAGNFLVNSRMNFYGVNLQHTDAIHQMFEKNFPEIQALYWGNFPQQSAPTYVGGESWLLCGGRPRPTIAFYQTNFLVHTSAALSGVDLVVPEFQPEPSGEFFDVLTPTFNDVNFIFYYNGRCIDQGTGRSLVLGSLIGSLASDLNTIVNPDAHLDVMQQHASIPMTSHLLQLDTAANNTKVTEGISGDISNQFAVNTVFLAHASNISIGTNGAEGTDINTGEPFALTSFPTLNVISNYFSFETQGGTLRQPEASMTTGEGGIFVDLNGTFGIGPSVYANIATMVTKSRNGIINLPKTRAFFNLRVGIAHWELDLSDPSQLVIVDFGESLSDYTLDWKYIVKDFCGTGTGVFIPYEFLAAEAIPCVAPAVTEANLTSLPTIHGIVDQMQIRNSRLGDPVHLLIDAGQVRELVFLQRSDSPDSITGNTTSDESGVAPIGFIVLQDDAILGLGTAHRNLDSTRAEVVLGINGVTLIANGTAQVVLNEDALINNVAHILTGTQFGVGGQQTLLITSEVDRELRIKNEGVLDLSQFSNENQVLAIGGKVKLVVEPGARIILGGGILRFTEQAQLVFQPYVEPDFAALLTVEDTDFLRAKISGGGQLIMSEDSLMQIFRGAYVGVETYLTCSPVTTMTWELQDNARLLIGDEANFGGSLQIGDTSSAGDRIDFTLRVNGQGALLNLNSQGFLGLNMGIVSKPNSAPNNWTVNTLNNVGTITIDLQEGVFKHNQILIGSDPLAGLLAIGDGPLYTFTFDNLDTEIVGGGNIVHMVNTSPATNPTVDTTDINTAGFGASIMSSRPMLADNIEKGAQPVAVTAQALFNYLKMSTFTAQIPTKLATVFQSSLGRSTVGWIFGATIRRDDIDGIIGGGGDYVAPTNSLAIGTTGLAINVSDLEPLVFEVNVGF
jgi:hypothetical protein